ncbi:hypothetical protein CLAFUW4_07960 [Fulvia fulva]|uniref:Glycosyltransferase family 34 protein n=1 Tax=Passalora fulva TaxID=5499 RepID=A0A9Q8LDW3_PASFU|nr:uncharacterized protein CLAFUR5_08082 [Fulvia fulva]KAK4629327.1 hypothetical protein CLAFUR4_07965 [Fulvia fulva]KAK4630326.1 hypothetical protein CLAFUR0_07962 [Fulvia fulva]UJO14888.1 hypothetical protein CLAFUR5_08082 [Fulvia fulva]WPV13010.1 hypothetical protein CLAFUW4_07960 [Fulvia fulva]WPV27722.1 hypothetical protein CLAFUW7_07961 [Fulvia fulva]
MASTKGSIYTVGDVESDEVHHSLARMRFIMARTSILFLFIVSLILATFEFTKMYHGMHVRIQTSSTGLETFEPTSYFFHKSTAINNRLTKLVGLNWTSPQRPTIGKCTVAHGKHNEAYQRAIDTHLAHSKVNGYTMFLLHQPILDGLWSKEAALLEVLLLQLAKPAEERLEWLMWFDADTVIINKLISLEIFLPPAHRPDVHLLFTKDWNGLNNGVFLIKVSAWSVDFVSSIVSFRTYRPEEELEFTEQSAMEKVMQMDQYKDHVVQCPSQWWNAYPNDGGEENVHFDHRPGQLLVHSAGIGDKGKVIDEWLGKLAHQRYLYAMPASGTNYKEQIEAFWRGLDEEREANDDNDTKDDPRRALWD